MPPNNYRVLHIMVRLPLWSSVLWWCENKDGHGSPTKSVFCVRNTLHLFVKMYLMEPVLSYHHLYRSYMFYTYVWIFVCIIYTRMYNVYMYYLYVRDYKRINLSFTRVNYSLDDILFHEYVLLYKIPLISMSLSTCQLLNSYYRKHLYSSYNTTLFVSTDIYIIYDDACNYIIMPPVG